MRQDGFPVQVDEAFSFAWRQIEDIVLWVEGDDRVPRARNEGVLLDADIHFRRTAEHIVLAVNAIVPAALWSVDANEPAHNRIRFIRVACKPWSYCGLVTLFEGPVRAGGRTPLTPRGLLHLPPTDPLDAFIRLCPKLHKT